MCAPRRHSYTYMHMCTRGHWSTLTHILTDMLTYMLTPTFTDMLRLAFLRTQNTFIHMCTYSHTPVLTHILTCAHSDTLACLAVCTCASTEACTHMFAHTEIWLLCTEVSVAPSLTGVTPPRISLWVPRHS